MAEIYDLAQRLSRKSPARTALRCSLTAKDSANLIAAVTLMDDAQAKFTAFAVDTQNPAVRGLFVFLARVARKCAVAIRDTIASNSQKDDQRRA